MIKHEKLRGVSINAETKSLRFKRCRKLLQIKSQMQIHEVLKLALSNLEHDAEKNDALEALRGFDEEQILSNAKALCYSSNSLKRKLGILILRQLGEVSLRNLSEIQQIFSHLLTSEQSPPVVAAIGWALSSLDLHTENLTALLARLKNHPEPQVRLGVVGGLLRNSSESAIRILIELSNDCDAEIRSWATFGLGSQIEVDGPDIRAALKARLNDDDQETRAEAIYGLAARRDVEVLDRLLLILESQKVNYDDLLAAKNLGNPKLIPALVSLRDVLRDDQDTLEEAIVSCQDRQIRNDGFCDTDYDDQPANP